MKVVKTRKFLIGLFVLLFSGVLSYLAGVFLKENYSDAVRPQDLLLDNIPEQKVFVDIYEVLIPVQIVLLIYSIYKNKFASSGDVMFRFGIMYILRAISMVVTPLAQIQDPLVNGSNPVLAPIFYNGMFFSGHTGLTFLIYFLDKGDNKILKKTKLVIAILVAISLVLSHSHYSIDIIGGFLVAYFVANVKINKKRDN